jgi:hypothetical protein
MPVFPSTDWMQAFCANLAGHPDAGRVASALEGTYRFVVEPAGPLSERQVHDVGIAPDGNGGAAVELLDGADKPSVTLTAGYDRWRQLIRGELDLMMAMMLRRLRVSGDIGRLRSNLGDAKPLLDALRGVETEWLE